ncbi:MAG: type I methionyl aminopeptidase [Candidatus Moraniibacteriota bacterium]
MIISNKSELTRLKEGGKILREALNAGKEIAKNSSRQEVSTYQVDQAIEQVILKYKALPSFKNYKPDGVNAFPAAACVSLNNEIVHGVPRKNRIIKEGDIVKIDVGVKYKKLYTDAAISFGVGKISDVTRKIIQVTRESLNTGLREIKPGNKLGDYGWAVENFVQRKGFFVVTGLVGHGVGKAVHEPPQIPNFGEPGKGEMFTEGMVIALEPMVNEKNSGIKVASDGMTFVTKKGDLSGHFENTVVVTKDGCEILTE